MLRFEDREGPENRGSTPIWWHSEKTEFFGASVEEADDEAVQVTLGDVELPGQGPEN